MRKCDLWNVYTNGREHVLVYCNDQMILERMVQDGKIREYTSADIYTVKQFEKEA